ncbi:MAG: FkbM family methyltransferase [Acidobacteria bacterium]|nr:FkbM family methyltransferase [Acidobacteriota bacterium]
MKVHGHERALMESKDRILNSSRLVQKDAKFHQWQTPMRTYWIPEGDDYVLPFNLAEQDVKIYGTGSHFVRKGDVVLDCGANVGVFTREALKAGARLVVAVEPAPENLECLRRNFAAETAAGSVIIYPKGVWDKDDLLTLNVDPHNTAADSFVIHREGAVAVLQVPLTTIDKMVAELKIDRVDFIKMDIEGAEPKALSGARDTLTRFKPRMSISAYHQADHPVTIPATIRSVRADYRMECGPCAEAGFAIRPDILYFE